MPLMEHSNSPATDCKEKKTNEIPEKELQLIILKKLNKIQKNNSTKLLLQ
jgi:hypothetical protein